MVGLDDLRGLLQPMIPWFYLHIHLAQSFFRADLFFRIARLNEPQLTNCLCSKQTAGSCLQNGSASALAQGRYSLAVSAPPSSQYRCHQTISTSVQESLALPSFPEGKIPVKHHRNPTMEKTQQAGWQHGLGVGDQTSPTSPPRCEHHILQPASPTARLEIGHSATAHKHGWRS